MQVKNNKSQRIAIYQPVRGSDKIYTEEDFKKLRFELLAKYRARAHFYMMIDAGIMLVQKRVLAVLHRKHTEFEQVHTLTLVLLLFIFTKETRQKALRKAIIEPSKSRELTKYVTHIYTGSAVSRELKKLKWLGYVTKEGNQRWRITEKGKSLVKAYKQITSIEIDHLFELTDGLIHVKGKVNQKNYHKSKKKKDEGEKNS